MDLIDDEVLRSLEVKPSVSKDVPDPWPGVIKKAQELRAAGRDGSTVESNVVCSEMDKVRFLAHIITGAPFCKTYDLYGGAVIVQFATPTNRVAEEVFKLVIDEECYLKGALPENRSGRLSSYMMVASIFGLTIDGDCRLGIPSNSWDTSLNYESFIDSVPFGTLRGVEEAYIKFKGVLDYLTKKATSQDFYQTP